MGGCKCTFRSCVNTSANSPGMHFFHYPLKDRIRCMKWVKYANKREILDLPYSKARNKVVCETHFKNECFMNYKKERLVHYAVPTIVRVNNSFYLDYEISDNPSPKPLSPPRKSHLIAPTSDLRKIRPSRKDSDSIKEEYILGIGDITSSGDLDSVNFSTITSDSPVPPKLRKITAPRILNSCFSNHTEKNRNIVCESTKMEILEQANVDITLNETKLLDEQTSVQFTKEMDNQIEIHSHLKDVEPLYNGVDDGYHTKLEGFNNDGTTDVNINYSLKKFKKKTGLLHKKDKKYIEHYLEKKKNNAINLKKNAQAETIVTSRQLPPSLSVTTPSKVQLFDSIKKYLSPSMATLVRMEMFGGPEREWKTDEKQVSVELLRLGDHFFKYLRDEWRFRLPPLKCVEKWLSESNMNED